MSASENREDQALLQAHEYSGPDRRTDTVPWHALTALYVSHGCSAWGQRMWEFDIGLVLLQLQPDSLQLVSIFGLADGGLQSLLGGAVGSYIDW